MVSSFYTQLQAKITKHLIDFWEFLVKIGVLFKIIGPFNPIPLLDPVKIDRQHNFIRMKDRISQWDFRQFIEEGDEINDDLFSDIWKWPL